MSSLYQDGYPSPSNHWWQATTLQHSLCFGGLPGRTVDVADNVKWQLWTTALWMCSASGCREQVRHTFLPDAGPCGWPREFCMSLAGQPTVVTGTTAPWCKEKEGHNLGKGVHVKNGPFPFAPIVLAEQHPSIHKTGQHTRHVWIWQVTSLAKSSELTKYNWRDLWVGWWVTATGQLFQCLFLTEPLVKYKFRKKIPGKILDSCSRQITTASIPRFQVGWNVN